MAVSCVILQVTNFKFVGTWNYFTAYRMKWNVQKYYLHQIEFGVFDILQILKLLVVSFCLLVF